MQHKLPFLTRIGETQVTRGYNLPAKYVIHALRPEKVSWSSWFVCFLKEEKGHEIFSNR